MVVDKGSPPSLHAQYSTPEVPYADTGETFSVKQWHHAVMVYTPSQIAFYMDGSWIGSEYVPIGNYSKPGDFHIGPLPGGGVIDDVRVYNIALTPEQVNSLYNE